MSSEYKCFQFEEPSLFDEQIGPAYKDDFYDDMKINNGSNNQDAVLTRIKAMEIKAVIQLTKEETEDSIKYSDIKKYWYNPDTGVVYDHEEKYAVGKIAYEDNLPKKLNKDTYIIDKMIPIPLIVETL